MAGFFLAKRYITIPRMGRVKFSAARKRRKRKVTLVLSLSVLVGLLLFLAVGPFRRIFGDSAGAVALGVFFINSVVVFSLGAYYLDYTRAYLWGWFFGLGTPLAVLLRQHTIYGFPLVFGVFSGVMIGTGVVLLVRFMRDYQPLPEPVNDAA
jgi:hypothetical protein